MWLDALHHSISSSSWLDAARAWVDANCAAFEPDPSEFVGQFQLFAEFRELAEFAHRPRARRAGLQLAVRGGRARRRPAALRARRRERRGGPRRRRLRKCLATLIDLDDFERFAKMMAARNYELEHETAVTIERARQPRSGAGDAGRSPPDRLARVEAQLDVAARVELASGLKTQNIAECKGDEDAKPSASDVEGDESSELARWRRTQRAVASSLLEAAPSRSATRRCSSGPRR